MNDIRPSTSFSVIIPTHNRSHLLSRAIRSVLTQSFNDFELLIVDDASTDETRDVIRMFSDNRITYIRREQNGGSAAAKNLGIRQATGKYVAFLDDDDEYLPSFLITMFHTLEPTSESVGFAWCGVRDVEDTPSGEKILSEGVWHPTYRNREHAYLSFLQHRRISAHNGLTVRRSCFASVGLFDEALKKAVDTEFLIRLVRSFDFVVVPDILVTFHNHSGPRVSKNIKWGAEAYEKIIQKHLETLRKHPDLWVALHYKAGWQYYHAGNKTRGREFMLQVLRKAPLHLKTWLGLSIFEVFGGWAPSLHQRISSRTTRFHSERDLMSDN